jgi:hypothetical protein
VWLVGQLAGLLDSGTWPDVPLAELPGILARLRDHAGDPAAAWPAGVRDRLPGPLGMYATLAAILATPLALGALAWWLHQPPAPPRPPATPPPAAGVPCHRPPTGRADAAAARAWGGAVTATTLSAQPSGLTGRARSGGDAQERAATNPVAALPCARTPLLNPLSTPLLLPLLLPSSATVGVAAPTQALFGQVRRTDPGRSRAKIARDRPGSLGKQQLWRATRSRWVAGAFVSGRPPTNFVGALPAGSPGHPHHRGWSDG